MADSAEDPLQEWIRLGWEEEVADRCAVHQPHLVAAVPMVEEEVAVALAVVAGEAAEAGADKKFPSTRGWHWKLSAGIFSVTAIGLHNMCYQKLFLPLKPAKRYHV